MPAPLPGPLDDSVIRVQTTTSPEMRSPSMGNPAVGILGSAKTLGAWEIWFQTWISRLHTCYLSFSLGSGPGLMTLCWLPPPPKMLCFLIPSAQFFPHVFQVLHWFKEMRLCSLYPLSMICHSFKLAWVTAFVAVFPNDTDPSGSSKYAPLKPCSLSG